MVLLLLLQFLVTLLFFRQVQQSAVEELKSSTADYLGPKTGGDRARRMSDV
jgi:hypothetical protein